LFPLILAIAPSALPLLIFGRYVALVHIVLHTLAPVPDPALAAIGDLPLSRPCCRTIERFHLIADFGFSEILREKLYFPYFGESGRFSDIGAAPMGLAHFEAVLPIREYLSLRYLIGDFSDNELLDLTCTPTWGHRDSAGVSPEIRTYPGTPELGPATSWCS
jgi:hypothetical protein